MGIMCPLVEIGLTDLPKIGGASAPRPPPLATGLSIVLNFGHRMRLVGKAWKQEGLLCRNAGDFHGRFAVFLNCKYANNCLASLLTSQLPIDVLFNYY